MPRPNKPRDVLAEDHLAQRIAAERDARGWTNDGLAKRMTDAGCPMNGSAIFKIEKGEPRRRIVVDEMVAFSRVFNVPVEELLMPPSVAASREFGRLVGEWRDSFLAREAAEAAENAARMALADFLESQGGDDVPDGDIVRVMQEAFEGRLPTEGGKWLGDAELDMRMWMVTRKSHYADRIRSALDKHTRPPKGGKS